MEKEATTFLTLLVANTQIAQINLKTTIPNQGNEDSDLQDRKDVEDEEQLRTNLVFAEEGNKLRLSSPVAVNN
ncbi:hypothetical protein INT47_006428 [Mucor saturninus]|uniref:Uncharacterized protein n=1 Tax=Mucor saturninus TaxID=64648 RepID=A0A8H7QH35_9FUNG|nr:hypothetical protein INT47_006428 [Mucor saturninus]